MVMPNLSKHHSSMANVLKEDPGIYGQLRERQTALGVGLGRCVKVGFDNRGHALVRTVGLVAGDAGSYETFRELFDPAMARQLGRLPERQPTDLGHGGGLSVARVDGTGQYVQSCSARAFRSFRGLRFPPAMTLAERCEVERLCSRALAEVGGDYHPLLGSTSYGPRPGGMTEEVEEDLRLKGALFEAPDSTLRLCSGAARHWPQGRGVFTSTDGSCVAWINEQEHLRLVVTEDGDNLQLAFRKLVKTLDDIGEAAGQEFGGNKSLHFPWAHSERLGFLTSNPMSIGTALQLGVTISLPRLAGLEAADFRSTPWCAWCAKHSVQVRAAHGKAGARVPNTYELSNAECLGVSEVHLVNLLVEAAGRLVAMEQQLERGQPIDELLAKSAILAPSTADVPQPAFVAAKLRATLAYGLSTGKLFEAMAAGSAGGGSLEAAILAASGVPPGAGSFASIEEAMSASIIQGVVGPPPRQPRSVDGCSSAATCTPEPPEQPAACQVDAELPAERLAASVDDDRGLANSIIAGAVESFAPGVFPDSCCTVTSASPELDDRPGSGMTLDSCGTDCVNNVCAEELVDAVLGEEVEKACLTPSPPPDAVLDGAASLRAAEAELETLLPAGLPRICVLGSTNFQSPTTEALVEAVARRLGAALGSRAVVVTGGLPGVQEAFAKHLGPSPKLFHLVKAGCQSGYGIGQDLSCGHEDRVEVYGRLGQVYLSFEGRPGVARQAHAAHARGALCLPLVGSGGASDFPAEALRRPEAATAEQWAAVGRRGADPEVAANAVAAVVLRHLGLEDASPPGAADEAELSRSRHEAASALDASADDGRLQDELGRHEAGESHAEKAGGTLPGPDADIDDLRVRLFSTITGAVAAGTIEQHFATAMGSPKEETPPEFTMCGDEESPPTPAKKEVTQHAAEPDAEATPCRQPEFEPSANDSHCSQALSLVRAHAPELTTLDAASPSASTMATLEAVSQQDRRIGELRAFVLEAQRKLAERDAELAKMEEKLAAAKADLQHLDLDVQWHKRALEGADDKSLQLSASQRCLIENFEDKQRKLMHASVDVVDPQLLSARSQISTAASISGNVGLGYTSVR